MADDKKKENQATDEGQKQSRRGRKGLLLGGGVLGLVAAAYAVSLVAVPANSGRARFAGPFVITLSPEDVQVNLSGDGGKRFLVVTLQAEYDAYEELYATKRVADPLYQAKLKDALIRIGRQKTKQDLDNSVGEDVFKAEVRDAVGPLLFPIHIGNPQDAGAAHEESGLAPGRSMSKSTMREGFFGHAITLDARKGVIRLDEGPPVQYQGSETDLELVNEKGGLVYVDVSGVKEEFVGNVPVGTFGTIRGIYFGKLLVQ